MQVVKRLILVLFFLAVLFGAVFGWKYFTGQQMAKAMSAPPPPAVVSSATVSSDTWQPSLKAVGNVIASKGVRVANEVAGVVKSISIESGQTVNAGDVLLTLDDDVDRADLAALVAAEKLANISYNRIRKLVREKTLAQSSLDEARATLDSAKALLNAKRASVNKKTIRAAFTGKLGIRQVDLGQYLAQGTEIVSLQSLSPVYVDYSLPERYLGAVTLGQVVDVTVPAFPGKTFEGKITAISPRLASGSRSVPIRATLENKDEVLLPGMFAEVATRLPDQKNVLTLPERVISYNPYGNAVFKLVENEGQLSASSQQIQTGEVRDGQIEIVSGLAEGDVVAADGINKLRNGQPVSVDNSIELDKKKPGAS